VVMKRSAELGEIVGPGAPLFVIGQFDKMKLVLDVPERDIGSVMVGAPVDLTVASLGDRQLTGSVTRVPRQAHTKTRTFPVEVTVDNTVGKTGGKLRAGMMARAALVLEKLPDQVVVPVDALVDEPTATLSAVTTVVFLAKDGKAQRRVVVSAATQGDRVVITQGLRGGEKLIVVGQRRVVHGDRIRVVEPKLAPAKKKPSAVQAPDLANARKPTDGKPAKSKKDTKPVALVN